MERKYKVGILGATGMVGQRFVTLLADHPWFELVSLAASARSAGKTYREAVEGRWKMAVPVPERIAEMPVRDITDIDAVTADVDFVFSAVDMKKEEIRAIEDEYAKHEIPVMSNNSAHRWTPDVPMIIPEINPEHAEVIEFQKKRLGTTRGFVAVKPNCSIQGYAPAIHALREFGPEKMVVCTYQAISGAGKNFETWPEMVDNVIPYIGGEEEKSEREPLKIFGHVDTENGVIVNAEEPLITAQCIRVPVTDGHMAAVDVSFKEKPSKEEIIRRWREYDSPAVKLGLPSAPDPFLQYCEEDNRPQTKLDRDFGKGMGVSLGRLREDTIFDYKFVGLAHNTLRGAAGGAVLCAEFLCAKGYIDYK
ncbi:MAG: aspartate-semialdehyde dehydrogenase [Lachnospiraceae bacterium]|nr:aspartate-semialdehyde dehydrogenase [Lachnospiraceae bacterium]